MEWGGGGGVKVYQDWPTCRLSSCRSVPGHSLHSTQDVLLQTVSEQRMCRLAITAPSLLSLTEDKYRVMTARPKLKKGGWLC